MDLKRLAELMMQYIKDTDNEGDFFDWADDKNINADELHDTIVKEIG